MQCMWAQSMYFVNWEAIRSTRLVLDTSHVYPDLTAIWVPEQSQPTLVLSRRLSAVDQAS